MQVLILDLTFRRNHRKLVPAAFVRAKCCSLYSFIYKTILMWFAANVENSKGCDAQPFLSFMTSDVPRLTSAHVV